MNSFLLPVLKPPNTVNLHDTLMPVSVTKGGYCVDSGSNRSWLTCQLSVKWPGTACDQMFAACTNL